MSQYKKVNGHWYPVIPYTQVNGKAKDVKERYGKRNGQWVKDWSAHVHEYFSYVSNGGTYGNGTHNIYCSCGDFITENHNWDYYRIEPTCISEGYDIDFCIKCGEATRSNYENALGHSGYLEQVMYPATCTEDGWGQYKCDICDSEYADEIPKLGHNFQPPDDHMPGYDYICTRCGEHTPDPGGGLTS